MNPKYYNRLLDLIVEFANESNLSRRHTLLYKISGDAFSLGFAVLLDLKKKRAVQDDTEDVAGQYQSGLVEKLDETAEIGTLSSSYFGTNLLQCEIRHCDIHDL